VRSILVALPVLAALALAAPAAGTSLWSDHSHSLYSNRKASRVGDVITVMIMESSSGFSRNSSSSSKEDSQELGGSGTGPLDFIPLFGWDFEAEQEFSGDASNNISGGLTAEISAQVVDILPNGHLVIEGSRSLTVNGDVEEISIFGEVRPEDVLANNTVRSTNVANARIGYTGEGPGNQAVKRGILHRLFSWIF